MRARIGRLLPRSRKARAAIAALLAVIVVAAVGGYIYRHNRTGNIYHPHARFVPQPTPVLPVTPPDRFAWPLYGYTKNHTRFFPAPPHVGPPLKAIWYHNTHATLEFPPVIYGERIFQLADDGTLSAISKHTGRQFWARRLGRLSASTPAVDSSTVYATILSTGSGVSPGRVVALNTANGSIRWSRGLPAPSESSPLLDRGRLYFGTQSGLVFALNASNGRVIWTYNAGGSVKASPSLSGGVLYFGDYSGHLQAISEQTGRRIWISSSEGALFGSGTFYSTPAVIYGRVFLGNTDGRVYAYDAFSGRLDWAVQTGNYVYASPAVTNAPGVGPTIYLGSYTGTFYAIDARSGHVRWTFSAPGKISGSATIIGRVVYFADLAAHRTYGLDVSTGRVVFQVPTGSFDSVISDGTHIFLTGITSLYSFAPR